MPRKINYTRNLNFKWSLTYSLYIIYFKNYSIWLKFSFSFLFQKKASKYSHSFPMSKYTSTENKKKWGKIVIGHSKKKKKIKKMRKRAIITLRFIECFHFYFPSFAFLCLYFYDNVICELLSNDSWILRSETYKQCFIFMYCVWMDTMWKHSLSSVCW